MGAINKVIFGSDTLIDLTADTVTEDTLDEGVTAHNAQGEPITGTRAVMNPSDYVKKSGDTMTGALIAQNNTNYTVKQVRNIILVADGETLPSGENGDICLVYTP